MYAAMLHDIDKEKEDHGEAAAETAEPWLEEILPTRYMINIREDILAIVSKHEEFKREFILSKILKRDISDIFKGLPLSLLGAHYVADVSSRADMDRFTVYTYENTVLEENHKDIDDVYSVKWEVEKNRFGPGERALLSLYEPWMHHCIEIYKDIEKVGPKALEDLYNMSYDSLLHDKKRYKKMTLLEICNELRFDLKPLEYPLLDPNGDIS